MAMKLGSASVAIAILGLVVLLAPNASAQSNGQFLCSGGASDGLPCTTSSDCTDGVCVATVGICDGGDDDGLPCDCAGGTCASEPACDFDPTLGTCAGGAFAGGCCDADFNCAGGQPCTGTQKVCVGGDNKGFACLQDSHCPGSECRSTGMVCVTGGAEGSACADDEDCLGGTCEGPAPTPPPVTCQGDCSADGMVSVDELLVLVNVALGSSPLVACLAGDVNGDGVITIDEILIAVNNALHGCPEPQPTATATPVAEAPTFTPTETPVPTETPTAESTPAPPTPTETGGPVATVSATPEISPTPSDPDALLAQRAAAGATTMIQTLPAIPAAVSAFTQLANGFALMSPLSTGTRPLVAPPVTISGECSGGGTREVVCTQETPEVSPRDYTLTLDQCVLQTSGGGTLTINGGFIAQSTETGGLATCDTPPTMLDTFSADTLDVTLKNAQDATRLSAQFTGLTGSAEVIPDFSELCLISSLDITVSGSATVETGGATVGLEFADGLQVNLAIDDFNSDCVGAINNSSLDGALTLVGDSVGGTFPLTLTDLAFGDDTTSGDDIVTLNGAASSPCLGTQVTYSTETPITVPDAACPPSGSLLLTTDAEVSHRVTYSATGIAVDLGNTGGDPDVVFPTCADLQTYMCPAE